MRNLPNPPLLVISDRSQTQRRIEEIALACFEGGCRWFSLREKDLSKSERVRMLYRLVSIGERFKATVSVHDDYDSALATGAAGVHLARDGSIARARAFLGHRGLIGISAHNSGEIRLAAVEGADYVTLSPVFASASKPGYGPALGLDGLGDGVRAVRSMPVVALGGVDATNLESCIARGAAGVAVMGAIMRAADPKAATRDLVTRLGNALAARGLHRHSPASP